MGEKLNLRDLPPAERHSQIHDAFESLDEGETLTMVNDHEPKPLYHEMKAEVEEFDSEGYNVEKHDERKFVAELPKL